MKSVFLLLILIQICFSQENQSITFAQSNCILFYQKFNQSLLSFQKCQSVNNSSANYQWLSWNKCISICCGLAFQAYPVFNKQSLVQCQQIYINVQRNKAIIRVITIVLCLVLGGGLIITIIYKIKEKFKQSKPVRQIEPQIKQNQTIDVERPIWLDETQQQSHITLSNLTNYQPIECPICLQLNPNLVSTCSHRFHVHCLLKWLSKNNSCPLCKRNNIQSFKLKCNECNNKYVLMNVYRASKIGRNWLRFNPVCGSCIQSPKVRKRSTTRDQSLDKFRCQVFESFDHIQC